MILCPLTDLGRYVELAKGFPQAMDWLQNPHNQQLRPGLYPIDGEAIRAIIEGGCTRAGHQARLESHRTYIDIQMNLEGPERMEWAPVPSLRIASLYRQDLDIAFYEPEPGLSTDFLVMPRWCALFWPEDAHKPSCHPWGEPVGLRKIVVKVAIAP